ncbi:MAG: hypothetical protein E6J90_38740 [Deltaproteobacteria bacterium]|nr:MAG: hypothetical protein E6J91_48295 [Deltaproteobacteria bacterium]TMQ09077.1 MAG: hypothetical protein E6J90_38740 [Deltaproteobacteria bacterium]
MRPRALAGRDGRAHGLGAPAGGLRVEVDRVLGAGEAPCEVGRVAREAVRTGQRLQLFLVASDEDRLGIQRVTVAEVEAALGAQREDRADEVLVDRRIRNGVNRSCGGAHGDCRRSPPHSGH